MILLKNDRILGLAIGLVLLLTSCTETPVQTLNKEAYLAEGKEIVSASGKVLMGALKQQLSASGPEAAVDFCNVHALGLIDSLSKAHQVKISRTSLKIRNPAHVANDFEHEILNEWQEKHDQDIALSPAVRQRTDGKIAYYHPIMIAPLCLNCHGIVGEQILSGTDSLLLDRYPNDQAKAYAMGDFRGMWTVVFEKEEE